MESEELKKAFFIDRFRVLAIYCGFFALVPFSILTIYTIWNVFILNIGVPNISSVSKFEIITSCAFLFFVILANIFKVMEVDKSIYASPPSNSYIKTDVRFKLFVAIILILMFVTN